MVDLLYVFLNFAKIIQNLDPNKARSRDKVIIHMLKTLGDSIYKRLEIKFKQFNETTVFASEWLKLNIIFIHKKWETLKITIQCSCSLFMEMLLRDYCLMKCWNILIENKPILSNQSRFKPADSCINQLLSIVHEIYESFDVRLEIKLNNLWRVAFDISIAFDKEWCDGIIFKLTQNGILGNLLKPFA